MTSSCLLLTERLYKLYMPCKHRNITNSGQRKLPREHHISYLPSRARNRCLHETRCFLLSILARVCEYFRCSGCLRSIRSLDAEKQHDSICLRKQGSGVLNASMSRATHEDDGLTATVLLAHCHSSAKRSMACSCSALKACAVISAFTALD